MSRTATANGITNNLDTLTDKFGTNVK